MTILSVNIHYSYALDVLPRLIITSVVQVELRLHENLL